MKNTINLLIFLQFILGIAYGQDYRNDVCTPKGTTVIAYITSENSNYWRDYYDTYYASAYPNAVQIETYDGYSSTRKFNCHGYAWHISEGGSDRWIGYGYPYDNNPEYTYWQDGSYVEVAQSVYPGKVNWSSGDHSAITTENPGVLISKWNEYPLMRHAWDDSPYGTSNLKYYKLNFSISGPSLVCSSGASFSLSNLPAVNSIAWEPGPNLSLTSGQNTSTGVFSATGSGSSWVDVTLNTDCGDISLPRKTVYAGTPDPQDIDFVNVGPYYPGSAQICLDMPNDGKVIWNKAGSVLEYEWDAGNWQVVQHPMDPFAFIPKENVQITAPPYGADNPVSVRVKARNACGWGTYLAPSLVLSGANCYSLLLVVSPNPSTVETTISVEPASAEAKSTEALPEWDLEIYNQGQQLKARKQKIIGSQATLNTTGWKEGVYIIRAKVNGEVLTEKLVVKEQ